MDVKLVVSGVFLIFLVWGCKENNSEPENDAGGTPDSGLPDAGGTESDYPRSIAHLSIEHQCPGCNEISVCDSTPVSERQEGAFVPTPRNHVAFYTSHSRMMAVGRSVELETCRQLSVKERRSIAHSDDSLVSHLEAGTITVESDSTEWAALPLSSDYNDVAGTYTMVSILNAGMVGYESGKTITLKADGGPSVAAFEATGTTPEPLVLLSPTTTDNGKISNVDTEAALTVSWEGGESSTVVIVLSSNWCTGQHDAVVCRANNDGAFVIPAEVVRSFEFARFASIDLWADVEVPILVPEIGDADVYWSIGTTTSVPIYHDPNAEPTLPEGCGPMSAGHVGTSCDEDDDCGSGCCLSDFEYLINGYCSVPGCTSNDECPSDAKCFRDANPLLTYITSFCAKTCSSDADCRVADGHICHPAQNVCVPNIK